jgi:hypothetical protein
VSILGEPVPDGHHIARVVLDTAGEPTADDAAELNALLAHQ